MLLEAVVNAAAATDNAIVLAPGVGFRIKLHGWYLLSAGTVNYTWRSGTTAKSGAMPLVANAGLVVPPPGAVAGVLQQPWHTCAENQALNLLLSAAVQVSGSILYSITPL